MKQKLKQVLLAGVLAVGTSLQAQDSKDVVIDALQKRLDELEQKLDVLERKDELNVEEAEKKAKETPKVTLSEKGFGVTSADKKHELKLKGLLQVDSRAFLDDHGINTNDRFLVRRARPIVTGKFYENYEFLLVPEFGGANSATGASSTVSILDAAITANWWKEFQLKAGKFKSPVGLEQLQSDPVRWFSETSLVTNLVPNRDVGIQIQGEAQDGLWSYAAGLFNGTPDGTNANNGDFDDEKEFAGRLFTHPFRRTDIYELHGLGLGVGGSYGNKDGGSTAGSGLTGGYVTDGQQTFYSYTNTVADGDHYRISPQGYYYYGPFGLIGEYALSSQEVRSTATNRRYANLQNDAWEVAAGWVITGEDSAYTGVKPKKNFSLSEGTWGAFELVGRYGELRTDDESFERYVATNGTNASAASSWAVGINWYLNSNVRINTSYHQTNFDRVSDPARSTAGVVPLQDEKVILTRLQIAY